MPIWLSHLKHIVVSPTKCTNACSIHLSIYLYRYYFPGWYSCGASRAYRCGVAKGSESPVLDDHVMAYLFAQVGGFAAVCI